MGLLTNLFGSGIGKSIEVIATEWIETKKESAEADAIMVRALDPNGIMRRELSRRVSWLYTLYILITLALIVLESFGIGRVVDGELAVSIATDKITDLFVPITTLFVTITTASFGVNYANVKGEK